MNSLSAPKTGVGISCLEFESGEMDLVVLCFDPVPRTHPFTVFPYSPPHTRFQGLGQRLAVLSPSVAET